MKLMKLILAALASAQNSTTTSTFSIATTTANSTTSTAEVTSTDFSTSVIRPTATWALPQDDHIEELTPSIILPKTLPTQTAPVSKPEFYQPISSATLITLILIVAAIAIAGLALFSFKLYTGTTRKEMFPQSHNDIIPQIIMVDRVRMEEYRPVDSTWTQALDRRKTIPSLVRISNDTMNDFDEMNRNPDMNTFGSRFESFAPLAEPLHDFDHDTLDRNCDYFQDE